MNFVGCLWAFLVSLDQPWDIPERAESNDSIFAEFGHYHDVEQCDLQLLPPGSE